LKLLPVIGPVSDYLLAAKQNVFLAINRVIEAQTLVDIREPPRKPIRALYGRRAGFWNRQSRDRALSEENRDDIQSVAIFIVGVSARVAAEEDAAQCVREELNVGDRAIFPGVLHCEIKRFD
jgi:hypothetical protein